MNGDESRQAKSDVQDRRTRWPGLMQATLLLVFLASSAGLLALGGGVPEMLGGGLRAELRIHTFELPSEYGIEPETIADELASRLQERARDDPALRTMLAEDDRKRMAQTIIPRLLNAGVLRRMIDDMDSLGTVIAVGDFGGHVTGTITNASAAPLEDVALTLPDVLRAESADDAPLTLETRDDRIGAIRIESIGAGQSATFRAWLSSAPRNDARFRRMVRLGAAEGLDGRVDIRAQTVWFGADLEVLPWARWLIAGMLALVALLSLFALAVSLVSLVSSKVGAGRTTRV